MKFLIVILFLLTPILARSQSWPEIVGPPSGEIPEPAAGAVNWRNDLAKAFTEAKRTGRPLLVTWRCLPCKQCASFDKDVLDGSPTLTPLLQRFVTLRMTDASTLDARIFPYLEFQDLDLSWWAYFMSPEGKIYGVFGGKDHISDATRISEAALVNSLKRVLDHHYDPRREAWNVDGSNPDIRQRPKTPKDHTAFASFKRKRPGMEKQGCIHCHQVADLENFGELEMGKFNLKRFTQPWPFPENVGLVVDRDDGLRVTKVEPGSAAAKVGILVGDLLAMAGSRKLYGQADFRGVLHRAPLGDAKIPVGWLRGEAYESGTLDLADGWRQSDISWRKSVYDGVYGPWIGFFPIKGPRQGKGSMSIRPFMGPNNKVSKNPWYKSGLRPNMEITAVNGRNDDWDSRAFLTWFKLHHKEGDSVTIQVKGGKEFRQKLPLQRP